MNDISLVFPLTEKFPITQGYHDKHKALDFGCPQGSAVLLDRDGKVTRADFHVNRDGSPGYGLHIQVQHPDGALSVYAHLSVLYVKAGQKCLAGDVIGRSGNTGNSTGAHLHYEYRPDGRTGIDPSPYFLAVNQQPGVDPDLPQPVELQPGDKIQLNPKFSYVNLRAQPVAGMNEPDLGDLTPDIILPVIAVDGEWAQVGVWVNSRYLIKAKAGEGS